MESINQNLFLWLNASAQPSVTAVILAKFFASYLIFFLLFNLLFGWLKQPSKRALWLGSLCSVLLALLLNQIIGLFYQHPRPFMIPFGHTLINHVADSSFPSDHLTVIWSVAVFLSWYRATRLWGIVWLLLGVPIAWARIYLGVHFPLDMLGALLVSLISAWIIRKLPIAHFRVFP